MRWTLKLKLLFTLPKRIRQTRNTASPITWKTFLLQYVFGFNKTAYWPMHHSSTVSGAQYIYAGIGTAPGLSHGCYIFAGKDSPVSIGDYTIVAPNVCIAGFNHDLYNYRRYESAGPLKIGKYCWLGMNCSVLPGTVLGDHTIVAAGAVVTTSFPEGYVVVGGNPARVIKTLDKDKCTDYRNDFEYAGYLNMDELKSVRNTIFNADL